MSGSDYGGGGGNDRASAPENMTAASTENVRCDLCQADDTRLLLVGRDRMHGQKGEFSVVQCRQCGMVYLNPRPTSESLATFYPEDYSPHTVGRASRNGLGTRLRRAIEREFYCGVHPRSLSGWTRRLMLFPAYRWYRSKNYRLVNRKPGLVLDIGCGTGEYLGRLRELGWNTFGVEPSAQAVRGAHQRGESGVVLSNWTSGLFPESHFDLVTMWWSLEHLPSPTAAVREAARVLRAEGLLVVAVPNFVSRNAKAFQDKWFHLDLPRHFYHFTPQSLTRLLDESGLEVLRLNFVAFGGLEESLRYVLEERRPGRKLLPKVVRRFLHAIDGAVALLGGGDLMIAYARKRNRV